MDTAITIGLLRDILSVTNPSEKSTSDVISFLQAVNESPVPLLSYASAFSLFPFHSLNTSLTS